MKGIWYSEDHDDQYGPIKMVTMFDGTNVVNAISIPHIMLFEASCVTTLEELQDSGTIQMPSATVKEKVMALARNICKQIGDQAAYTKIVLNQSSEITQ